MSGDDIEQSGKIDFGFPKTNGDASPTNRKDAPLTAEELYDPRLLGQAVSTNVPKEFVVKRVRGLSS